jgi:beta-glucosidase-like glycosyl hydrolase
VDASLSFDSGVAADTGGGGGAVVGECDKAANAAHKAELLAAQPTVAVKASSGKSVITAAASFASLGGDASVVCTVDLKFRDLNGNATLEPFEDWTLTAAVRAQDLAERMTTAQKRALMAHAALTDTPTASAATPSTATTLAIDAGIRFGRTAANTAQLAARATWANALQERCEAGVFGIPFVLSMEPAHSSGNGRTHAKGFSQWPSELGLGATGDTALVRKFGQFVSQEYRAIGVRMALSPVGNLATDPRWYGSQFTFGEGDTGPLVAEYVKGLQGTTLGTNSVAAVIGHFPGAGAAKGGFDARLAKGKAMVYAGNQFDAQVAPFQAALGAGALGVIAGYGIPETGAWTGLAGLVDGASIEQVGVSFNAVLLNNVLRTAFAYNGLVVAPEGVLDAEGGATLGAPWGMETATRGERVAKAVAAGVDQFIGLGNTADLDAAGLTDAQVNASAKRALTLIFQLGLFENPYVDAAKAPSLCNTDTAYQTGLDAMNRGMVLLVNKAKPSGWLNGKADGTQTSDKGNAGNGSGKVLPAPPGEPYVAAGCDYYVAGDFDLDYIRSVSAGYGTLTNDATSVKNVPVTTAAQRMALSDYIFIRIASPFLRDADSGALAQPMSALTYASTAPTLLDPVIEARAAIKAWTGSPASQAQIVVVVDAGRPSVMSELLSATYDISGLYLAWMGTMPGNAFADKVVLDVAFGIVDGKGTLASGLPASDMAAAAQLPDTAGDGQDATFVRGFGLQTNHF